ncbi:MAG: hypothetical protein ACR2J8_01290 [Thermomicrobiales bacterium]
MAVLVLSMLTAAPTAASNTLSQQVLCPGTPALTARVLGQNQPDGKPHVTFQAYGQRHSDAYVTLVVSDSTCRGNGWNVTLQALSLSFKGTGGAALTPRDLTLVSVGSPAAVTGSQSIGVTGGPLAVNQLGTMDRTRKVIRAAPKFGLGTYTQRLSLRLSFPNTKAKGTYTATVVVTAATGPGS